MKPFKNYKIFGSALFLYFLMAFSVAQAATYWASTAGNDTNSCASVSGDSDPGRYRTIAGAISCISGSGNTVMIKDGTYTQTNAFNNMPSGASGAFNTVRAQNIGKVIYNAPSSNLYSRAITWSNKHWIRFQGIIVDGSNLTNNPFRLQSSSSDIEFLDFTVRNAPSSIQDESTVARITYSRCSVHSTANSHGFYMHGVDNIIEHCDINNNAGFGIQLYDSPNKVSARNIVRYNRIWNNGFGSTENKGGIWIAGSGYHQIYGNIFYQNHVRGIIAASPGNNKIYNNTVYNNYGVGIDIPSSGNDVRNNISFDNTGSNISNRGSGNTVSNNLTTDPLFTDAANANFRLKLGSPAIDKGVTISIVSTDIDGLLRPQGGGYDIGAYEYKATTLSSPPAPSNLEASAQ